MNCINADADAAVTNILPPLIRPSFTAPIRYALPYHRRRQYRHMQLMGSRRGIIFGEQFGGW